MKDFKPCAPGFIITLESGREEDVVGWATNPDGVVVPCYLSDLGYVVMTATARYLRVYSSFSGS